MYILILGAIRAGDEFTYGNETMSIPRVCLHHCKSGKETMCMCVSLGGGGGLNLGIHLK